MIRMVAGLTNGWMRVESVNKFHISKYKLSIVASFFDFLVTICQRLVKGVWSDPQNWPRKETCFSMTLMIFNTWIPSLVEVSMLRKRQSLHQVACFCYVSMIVHDISVGNRSLHDFRAGADVSHDDMAQVNLSISTWVWAVGYKAHPKCNESCSKVPPK